MKVDLQVCVYYLLQFNELSSIMVLYSQKWALLRFNKIKLLSNLQMEEYSI